MARVGTFENLEYEAAKSQLLQIYEKLKKKAYQADVLVESFDKLKMFSVSK